MLEIFMQSFEKIQTWLKLDKNIDKLHEDLREFLLMLVTLERWAT